MDRIKEACGVFGCYDLEGNDVVSDIYYGLNALQHRGQESCGIAVSDTAGEQGNVRYKKDLGMVQEVFREGFKEELFGDIGIGHVRYSTTGETTAKNAQPLVLSYAKGSLSLAHNGNLVNIRQWREKLEGEGMIFHTTTDSEVIACCIARERVRSASVEEAVRRTLEKIRGAYALVIMSPRKLLAVRDPLGLKPLCLGRKGNRWVAASESCALEAVGAAFVRDVKPGEMVSITPEGIRSEYFRQRLPGAPLSTFTLPGWTACWTRCPSMRPDSGQAGCSMRRGRWRRIWWRGCPTPVFRRPRATRRPPASPSGSPSTKTAMWGGPLSSPPSRSGRTASA